MSHNVCFCRIIGIMAAEKWLSVAEASELIGRSERTIRRWLAQNKIPSKKTAAGLRVDVSEFASDTDTTEAAETPANDTERLAALEAENELLKRENQRLWGALELAMTNQQRLIEASAPGPDTGADTTPGDKNKRKWWQFWQ